MPKHSLKFLLLAAMVIPLAWGSGRALAQDDEWAEEADESAEEIDVAEAEAPEDVGEPDEEASDEDSGEESLEPESQTASDDSGDQSVAPASPPEPAEAPAGDLQSRFERATRDAQQLPEKPDSRTYLRLYALMRQGADSDNYEKKPGDDNPDARAKWQAWEEIRGMSKEDAMAEYADLVESLK